MDLWHATGSAEVLRFPRPRGDGPPSSAPSCSPLTVSPPTRGWTPLRGLAIDQKGGFPAHAGMDLTASSRDAVRCGFPRPRGDGPSHSSYSVETASVSPPTRGWTFRLRPPAAPGTGFPAHAGMDLLGHLMLPVNARFPRPRGDGPVYLFASKDLDRVSPPTRGWTFLQHVAEHAAPGFPAHAGMDHLRDLHAAVPRRFPRPRGDGPVFMYLPGAYHTVSPPTRGWTA